MSLAVPTLFFFFFFNLPFLLQSPEIGFFFFFLYDHETFLTSSARRLRSTQGPFAVRAHVFFLSALPEKILNCFNVFLPRLDPDSNVPGTVNKGPHVSQASRSSPVGGVPPISQYPFSGPPSPKAQRRRLSKSFLQTGPDRGTPSRLSFFLFV